MSEILPCRFCGNAPTKAVHQHFWSCGTNGCRAVGPEDDERGAKWNAMMGGGRIPYRDDRPGDKRRMRFEAACAADDADILYWLEILRSALRDKDKFGGPTRIDARIAFADALIAELDKAR